MISPEAERFADLLRSGPKMADMVLVDQRIAEHAEDLAAEPEGVIYTSVDEADVRGLWPIPSPRSTARPSCTSSVAATSSARSLPAANSAGTSPTPWARAC